MYACICKGITEAEVKRVGRSGIVGAHALIATLGLNDAECCGRCVEDVEQFVELAWEGASEAVFDPRPIPCGRPRALASF